MFLKSLRFYFIVIFIAGFLLYLPSLSGPFLWDDEDFVYANRYVTEFRVDKFFSDSVTAGRDKLSNYYRPIQSLTYATVYAVTGFNPLWYHLVGILVHLAATVSVFYFLIVLTGRRFLPIALVISMIFLVHPVQTEAVSYISGLSDPLFVLFGFLGLTFFWKRERRKYFYLSILFFTFSLLSKETGIVFLGLMLLFSWYQESFAFTKKVLFKLKQLLPYIVITSGYLWYHLVFINRLDMKAAWGNSAYANSMIVRILTFIQNLKAYVGLLVFPRKLFMERDYSTPVVTNPFTPTVIGHMVMNIFLLVLLWVFRQKGFISKPRLLLLLFFLAGFYVTFLPYSGVFLINGMFYEHFLYLPLVFFFGFWLFFLEIFLKPKVLYLICLIMILGFAARNFVRQMDFRDAVRFYQQTLTHAPKSIRVRNGLAIAYAERGKTELAINEYKMAIEIAPNVPNLYYNLANAYLVSGNVSAAERYYLKAIEVDPKFVFSWSALFNLYQQTGQEDKLKNLREKYNSLTTH